MKKTMLFFAAMLFSLNASAASLNLVGAGTNKGSVVTGSGDVVTASWSSNGTGGATISDSFTASSDVATAGTLSLTFNPLIPSTSVSIFDGIKTTVLDVVRIGSLGVVEYSWILEAATDYVISVMIGRGAAGSNYDLRLDSGVSEVPVPAALWLFAPALLGFFGLRRKAKNAVA
ncbi:hypothetical protein [Methylophaga pinxianii]|uniref:hypothetical protein n=1 Tax=Methylophaga pinxianii TaxID=2881052 RepID=UPI001CF19D12|nr:hypothetical protein [Methylophaga pinxianii]MCB2425883.1 hypothetical protein [Methylophaga pinxianii]UPH45123.1 hypothetical protein LGT42_011465 [Methylophaga pinxianii]